jgi:hypothetical protein
VPNSKASWDENWQALIPKWRKLETNIMKEDEGVHAKEVI